MSLIKGVHHINLSAEDEAGYRKAVAFYTEVLGLKVVHTWSGRGGESCMISTGDARMEIGWGKTPLPQGTIRHFALATDDVAGCVEAVRSAGYEITAEPRDVNLGGNYPATIAFCIGPCGEEIEFFCEN